jgi:hypothetical protein
MSKHSKQEIKDLILSIEDDSSEGGIETARIIKTRLKELFAHYQAQAPGSYDSAKIAIAAGRGYVEVSEYIDSAEKRLKLLRGHKNKQTPQ